MHLPKQSDSFQEPTVETSWQALRILLVEDNLVNQKIATRILERLGYACDWAENGWEAVDATLHDRYDLIFMDVNLPGLDGLWVTQYIRQMELTAGQPQPYVVAMTASDALADRHRCTAAGMNDWISKPLQLSDFQRILSLWPTLDRGESEA